MCVHNTPMIASCVGTYVAIDRISFLQVAMYVGTCNYYKTVHSRNLVL